MIDGFLLKGPCPDFRDEKREAAGSEQQEVIIGLALVVETPNGHYLDDDVEEAVANWAPGFEVRRQFAEDEQQIPRDEEPL